MAYNEIYPNTFFQIIRQLRILPNSVDNLHYIHVKQLYDRPAVALVLQSKYPKIKQ